MGSHQARHHPTRVLPNTLSVLLSVWLPDVSPNRERGRAPRCVTECLDCGNQAHLQYAPVGTVQCSLADLTVILSVSPGAGYHAVN